MNRLPRLILLLHLIILTLLLSQPFLAPVDTAHPGILVTLLILLPGLAVLPGLLKERANSIVWTALTALLYLTIAITDAWSLDTLKWLNLLIAVLCISLFSGAWWHMKTLRAQSRTRLNNSQSK